MTVTKFTTSLFVYLVVALSLQGCEAKMTFDHPSFSGDEKLLAFDKCENKVCESWLFDFSTKSTRKLLPLDDREVRHARFSPSSGLVVFTIPTRAFEKVSQIGVMDISTGKWQIVTNSPSTKFLPLIDPTGKKVHFVTTDPELSKDLGKPSGLDFREADLAASVERPITQLRAYSLYPTYWAPDGRIFFTAFYTDSNRTRKEGVFFQKPDEALNIPLDFDWRQGSIAIDGTIAFFRRTDLSDGKKSSYFLYDVFLWSNGKERRLTSADRYMKRISIAPSGKFIAVVVSSGRATPEELWVLSSTGQKIAEISQISFSSKGG